VTISYARVVVVNKHRNVAFHILTSESLSVTDAILFFSFPHQRCLEHFPSHLNYPCPGSLIHSPSHLSPLRNCHRSRTEQGYTMTLRSVLAANAHLRVRLPRSHHHHNSHYRGKEAGSPRSLSPVDRLPPSPRLLVISTRRPSTGS
jgi:hypothetical protein